MHITPVFALFLLLSLAALPFLARRSYALVEDFTHSVFDEVFGWTSWDGCQADETSHLAQIAKYSTNEQGVVHSLHIVSFHISGPFYASNASERWTYYKLRGAPSNVYDGHYRQTNSIDSNAINASGMRQIRKLEMTLSKNVEGQLLSFQGSVGNLESQGFSGFMLVFVTENGLVDPAYPTITWNRVFRDYALNRTLNLASSEEDTFQGKWNIPGNVQAANIEVVAAVYDADSRDVTNGWTRAVQSVCDVCGHSIAVPEFLDVRLFGSVFLATTTAALLVLRRFSAPCREKLSSVRKDPE